MGDDKQTGDQDLLDLWAEQGLKHLFEQTTVGMVLTGPNYQILDANPAWCRMLGYTRDELRQMHYSEFTHPDDVPKSDDFGEQISAGGEESKTLEKRHLTKNGDVVWVTLRSTTMRDADGEFLYALTLIENINKIKRAEEKAKEVFEQLHDSEAELRSFMESAPEGIVVSNETGRMVLVNEETVRLFGYTREELLGMSVEDLMPESSRGRHAVQRKDFYMNARSRSMGAGLELLARKKDGTEFPVEISLNPANLKGGHRVLALIRDTSESRKLLESRLGLAMMVDASNDSIIGAGMDGTIKSWNRSSEQIYGYSEQEAVGMPIMRLTPPDRRRESTELREQIFQGESVQLPDTIRLRKNGEQFPVSLSAFPLKDIHGNVVGWAGVSRDLTDQKRLEEQFQRAQKMQAIGQLAGGVAHDFNNIMTVIEGHAGLVADDLQQDAPSKQNLAAIKRAVGRGTTLTRQLLAFSRTQRVEMQVLDPNDLLRELLVILKRTLGETIIVHTQLESSGLIEADPAQLEQVIVNLATNARDAMPDGGELFIETADVTSETEERSEEENPHWYLRESISPGSYVRLKVSDTGVGMDRNTMIRSFEPFYTTKERGKGTGLGLAAVYGIVAQAGGSVCVESEVGQGSSFYVYFPKTEEVVKPIEKVVQQETLDVGRRNILLVEDDEDILDLAVLVLKKGGYTVLSASKPQDALDHYSGESIDLILTDVVMPGMSGPKFVREWEKQNPSTKVLYMSGYIDESLGHHSIPKSDILTKPFDPPELLRRVSQRLTQ